MDDVIRDFHSLINPPLGQLVLSYKSKSCPIIEHKSILCYEYYKPRHKSSFWKDVATDYCRVDVPVSWLWTSEVYGFMIVHDGYDSLIKMYLSIFFFPEGKNKFRFLLFRSRRRLNVKMINRTGGLGSRLVERRLQSAAVPVKY